MAHCDIIPLKPTKACSGKCKGDGGCAPQSTVWVLAVCEGMVALFRKQADGHLLPLLDGVSNVSSFTDELRDRLTNASEHAKFTQLVLVGSANDIAWTQASLPVAVSKQVVAEIKYPLMSEWFGEQGSPHLNAALKNVFSG